MLAQAAALCAAAGSASNAPPALSPRDTLADSLVSGRENASTTDAGSRGYRICRNCGSNAAVDARKVGRHKLCECQHAGEQEYRTGKATQSAVPTWHSGWSPVDAVSRMQTVSSTTVLPHERPVNTVFCRKMLMRAMDASSGNSEVKASTHCAGAECRTRSDSLAAPIPASAQTVHAECSGVHALPVGGKIQ